MASDVCQPQSKELRTCGTNGISPSLKAREDEMKYARLRGRLEKEGKFLHLLLLFYAVQWTGWGPPTLGRAICFTEPPDSNADLIWKQPTRHTQK